MSMHILDRLRAAGREGRLARFLRIERRSGNAGDRRTFQEMRPRDEAASGGEQRMESYLRQARRKD